MRDSTKHGLAGLDFFRLAWTMIWLGSQFSSFLPNALLYSILDGFYAAECLCENAFTCDGARFGDDTKSCVASHNPFSKTNGTRVGTPANILLF